MKLYSKIAAITAAAAIFLGSFGVASAAPYDWNYWFKAGDGITDVSTKMPTEATSTWALMGNGQGDINGSWYYINGDNGIIVSPASSEDAPYQAGNFELGLSFGYIADHLDVSDLMDAHNKLSGEESTTSEGSDISNLQSEINSLGGTLDIGAFMNRSASTSPYIATSTFTGFMSGAMVTKLAATPTIQRTRVTTDGSGNYTWTFPTSFGSSTPIVSAVVEDSSSAFSNVQVTSVSGSSVTVHAGKLTSTLGILTLATNATVPVDLIAISA